MSAESTTDRVNFSLEDELMYGAPGASGDRKARRRVGVDGRFTVGEVVNGVGSAICDAAPEVLDSALAVMQKAAEVVGPLFESTPRVEINYGPKEDSLAKNVNDGYDPAMKRVDRVVKRVVKVAGTVGLAAGCAAPAVPAIVEPVRPAPTQEANKIVINQFGVFGTLESSDGTIYAFGVVNMTQKLNDVSTQAERLGYAPITFSQSESGSLVPNRGELFVLTEDPNGGYTQNKIDLRSGLLMPDDPEPASPQKIEPKFRFNEITGRMQVNNGGRWSDLSQVNIRTSDFSGDQDANVMDVLFPGSAELPFARPTDKPESPATQTPTPAPGLLGRGGPDGLYTFWGQEQVVDGELQTRYYITYTDLEDGQEKRINVPAAEEGMNVVPDLQHGVFLEKDKAGQTKKVFTGIDENGDGSLWEPADDYLSQINPRATQTPARTPTQTPEPTKRAPATPDAKKEAEVEERKDIKEAISKFLDGKLKLAPKDLWIPSTGASNRIALGTIDVHDKEDTEVEKGVRIAGQYLGSEVIEDKILVYVGVTDKVNQTPKGVVMFGFNSSGTESEVVLDQVIVEPPVYFPVSTEDNIDHNYKITDFPRYAKDNELLGDFVTISFYSGATLTEDELVEKYSGKKTSEADLRSRYRSWIKNKELLGWISEGKDKPSFVVDQANIDKLDEMRAQLEDGTLPRFNTIHVHPSEN